MILFCDTSAMVKLYVVEAESAAVKDLVTASEVVAVCRIAWAEAYAAFARRAREVPADAAAIENTRRALASDCTRLLVLEVTQLVVEVAGEFADTFALRAYHAVQLAAAHHARTVAEEPLVFASFDARLNKASRVLGMEARFGA